MPETEVKLLAPVPVIEEPASVPTRLDTPDADNPEAIVQSVVEATNDSKKVRFLGFRASGFTIRESLSLVGIHEKTLHRWREGDAEFVRQESKLSELRKTLGIEFAHLEFVRNYRLILEKDYQVISDSLNKDKVLTLAEHQYLMKARSHYTPQQLEVIQRLIGATKEEAKDFNFTDFIMTLSRTKSTESVTITAKNKGGE